MDLNEIVDFLKKAERLKSLYRTGWAIEGVEKVHRESIAAHSWGTNLISLLISRVLIESGTEVDIGRVLTMSSIHDLVESVTSDIPQRALSLGPSGMKEAKQDVEESAMRFLTDKMKALGEGLFNDWIRYSNSDDIEARIVRDADTLDMLVHAVALEDAGVSPSRTHSFFLSAQEKLELSDLGISKEIWRMLVTEHEANAARQSARLE